MLSAAYRWALALFLAAAPLTVCARAQELVLAHHGERATLSLTLGHGHGGARIELRGRRGRDCERVWIQGHYETRCERVWVAGCTRREWVPAVYEWRRDYGGHCFQVLVCEGYWHLVTEPGRFETREVQVWVPGTWRGARD